jgi:imidazole glycerol phosphate synthase glutamine amidotransferase subunit
MSAAAVAIVRTGLANVASVTAAFERLGVRAALVDDAETVRAAPAVVLPGVGSFGHGVRELARSGIDAALRERIDRGMPTLAICLGLQLLCRESEEAPGEAGLAIIDERVTRFSGRVQVPQLGWNHAAADEGCAVLVSGPVYFANSYRAADVARVRALGWRVAVADHDGEFVAGVERGCVAACQFHPELSGITGATILSRWLRRAGVNAAAPAGAASC